MHLQFHWAPCAFTGIHPYTNPQSRCPPQPFFPIPGSRILSYISYKRQHSSACVLARCGVQPSKILVDLWPTCVVFSRYVSSPVAFDWLPPVRRGPRGLPSPRIFMFLGGMKAAFVPSPSRDLGVRGASIVRCGLSCLVDLNSDLYRLCGSLHGPDTFWARGLS